MVCLVSHIQVSRKSLVHLTLESMVILNVVRERKGYVLKTLTRHRTRGVWNPTYFLLPKVNRSYLQSHEMRREAKFWKAKLGFKWLVCNVSTTKCMNLYNEQMFSSHPHSQYRIAQDIYHWSWGYLKSPKRWAKAMLSHCTKLWAPTHSKWSVSLAHGLCICFYKSEIWAS